LLTPRGSAGACGIVRTIELGGISSKNYTFDATSIIIWSAAELTVTMICIGIPTVARPVWRKIAGETAPRHSKDRYCKHTQDGTDAVAYDAFYVSELPDNGVSELPENGVSELPESGVNELPEKGVSELPDNGMSNATKLGLRGTTTLECCELGHNGSDEEILGPEFRQGQILDGREYGAVHVTNAVTVQVQAGQR